jgi:5-formyltetrahydrofolate cyclo-ligase
MDEIKERKQEIRDEMINTIKGYSEGDLAEKKGILEDRLFGFANFQEANITLLSVKRENELDTTQVIDKALNFNKIVILPAFDMEKSEITLMKIDSMAADMIDGPLGNLEPDPSRCKVVPIESVDIALIPGFAFDEKGGRIGTGNGFYDRFIPKLPVTTRKIALALEEQIIQQVPMESHDKYVDIIITDKRIIYKI